MDPIRRLEEIFAHFPGIGPRQARRFVYYVLNKPASFAKEFSSLINEVRSASFECNNCKRIFLKGVSGSGHVCFVCADKGRDQGTLMVVSRDSDFETVEKSGAYAGLYFILGGTVPILDKEPEKRIRLRDLLMRVSDLKPKEVILSLSATPDGEHTANIVRDALEKMFSSGKSGHSSAHSRAPSADAPKVSVLGRGLSTGAELEYVDGDTIKNALENRH